MMYHREIERELPELTPRCLRQGYTRQLQTDFRPLMAGALLPLKRGRPLCRGAAQQHAELQPGMQH